MVVTELGIVREVKLLYENVPSPMVVTESGIVREVKLLDENA